MPNSAGTEKDELRSNGYFYPGTMHISSAENIRPKGAAVLFAPPLRYTNIVVAPISCIDDRLWQVVGRDLTTPWHQAPAGATHQSGKCSQCVEN